MAKIFDFSDSPVAQGVFYGGDAGAKEAIVYDDAIWMIKYPKTTRDLVNPQISYTTSPLSEYLGTKIYEILGFPTHEVKLGIRKNKVVVACRDFVNRPAYYVPKLIHFHDLKNSFMSNDVDEYSGTGSETFLDEVLATIQGEKTLQSVDGVLERFWDMFVVDAFIGNNDRNNGNWGLVSSWGINPIAPELAPIYDNGNAFFNKRSIKQMASRLADDGAMKEDAYQAPTCVYKYTDLDSGGHKINPYKFIAEAGHDDCTAAVERFLERVDMEKIASLIHSIPESTGTLGIMPDIQKEFYLKLLQIRLEKLRESVV
ncbi:MAG: HipA domain-containing protein [Turicibacter sp.]|nr:HipA domain-containing protein [Turicibacter sp.]